MDEAYCKGWGGCFAGEEINFALEYPWAEEVEPGAFSPVCSFTCTVRGAGQTGQVWAARLKKPQTGVRKKASFKRLRVLLYNALSCLKAGTFSSSFVRFCSTAGNAFLLFI